MDDHKHSAPWLAPLSLLLLAAAVRGVTMAYMTIDADMAIIGLMARHILQGELPVFFYGESWGGSIESFIAAPFFWLFGSSVTTLSLAPTLVSLLFVWLVYKACTDMWGRTAGLMAMALAALPPFYLAWHSVLPRGAYIETPLFSLLLVWITFRLTHRQSSTWLWLAYGLAAGLGMWTHFLIIFALAATSLYLLAADWRVLIRRSLPLMLAGFLIGGLPMWLHNLAHDWDSFRSLLAPGYGVGVGEAFRLFFTLGLPILLGVFNDGSTSPTLPVLSWAMAALAVAALGYLLWLRRRGIGGLARLSLRQSDGSELFLLLGLMTLAVVSLQGDPIGSSRRHLVPLYAALIPLGGYVFSKLHEKRRLLSWLLAGLVLVSNLLGIAVNSPLFNDQLRQEASAWRNETYSVIEELGAQGVRTAYSLDFWVAPLLTFLSQERLVVARPQLDLEDFHESSQRRVEHSRSVNWVSKRMTRELESMLKTMGATYQTLGVGSYACFLEVRPPFAGLRGVPREGWRVWADQLPQDAALALDGDALTRWSPLKPQQPGQRFLLDLGHVVDDLCLARLASGNFSDQPKALVLELSLDGQHWTTVASMGPTALPLHWDSGRTLADLNNSRLDLYFPPQPARYLRLTQTGRSPEYYWSLQEINLYTSAPAQSFDPAAAVELTRRLGTRVLYADTHLSAFAPTGMWPPLAEPPSSRSWPVELCDRGTLPDNLQGVAVAVSEADAESVAAFLSLRRVRFQRSAAGGYVIFHDLNPARPPTPGVLARISLATSSNPGQEALAADGDPDTAWQTGRPRREGDFWQADLGQNMALHGLILESTPSPTDLTRAFTLAVSEDGLTWREVAWEAEPEGVLYFAGDRLLSAQPARLRLRFPVVQAHHLRLTLTQGHPVSHWAISEMSLLTEPALVGGAK